ncbi:hypothetical protein Mapa_005685 [Marchantia paleacea]|nr:hypothetical protein Mapa_005685 [Marchantia paleacea]
MLPLVRLRSFQQGNRLWSKQRPLPLGIVAVSVCPDFVERQRGRLDGAREQPWFRAHELSLPCQAIPCHGQCTQL